MNYIIRKLNKKKYKGYCDNKNLKVNSCLNADLNNYFITENQVVSVYICQKEDNNLERVYNTLAASSSNGLKENSYYIIIEIDMEIFNDKIHSIGVELIKNKGQTFDEITNNYHYDIKINNLTNAKSFNELIFNYCNFEVKEIEANKVIKNIEILKINEDSNINWKVFTQIHPVKKELQCECGKIIKK